jgi:hypothetical protein
MDDPHFVLDDDSELPIAILFGIRSVEESESLSNERLAFFDEGAFGEQVRGEADADFLVSELRFSDGNENTVGNRVLARVRAHQIGFGEEVVYRLRPFGR